MSIESGAVAEATTEGIRLRFLDEGQSEPVEMLVTQKLASALVRAALSQGERKFALSFSSLLLGIWATRGDATTRWLTDTLPQATERALLNETSVSMLQLQQLRDRADTALDRWETVPMTRTVSARLALDEAARLAQDLGRLTDTRHLVAAYLSLPGYHEDDFRRLRVDRPVLAKSFGMAMALAYEDEDEFWKEFAIQPFLGGPRTKSGPAPKAIRDATLRPNLGTGQLETHVASALALAAEIAQGRLIGPLDVLLAVLALPTTHHSSAFGRLAAILPLAPDEAHVKLAQSVSSTQLPDASRLAPALARLLAGLQAAQRETGARRGIWGRDLVAAALLSDDPELDRFLAQVRCPIDDARDQWFGFVTSDAQGAIARSYWERTWHLAGVPLPVPYRSGYATETDEGEDKLGVEGEAMAFARLILDRNVAPPLSIGLLGDWGSGKSFFIEQIKKQIKGLTSGGHPELYSNVIEIEFNAWHASDSNLWASLVTHIFDEIWDKVSVPEQSGRKKQDAENELTAAIDKARGAVHQAEGQVSAAQAGLAAAEQELERRKQDLVWEKRTTEVAAKALKKAADAVGWRRQLQTINDVSSAFQELSVASKRLQMVGASLLERPLLYVALPVCLALASMLGVWHWLDGVKENPFFVQLSKWVTTAVGAVGSLVVPIRLAVAKVNEFASKLKAIQEEYDASITRLSKDDPEKARQLKDARRELESAEASVESAKNKLGELLNQQATMEPRQRLGAFLEARVQSTQYRSQQGIIALAHRDFRVLSQLMKKLRDPSAQAPMGVADSEFVAQAEKVRAAVKPFDRIVLYVDDLDRCRPDHVVAMLEALHLLLALELFVAVVAVDARWLTRSLEVHYKDLLVTEEDDDDRGLRLSTPQGYLEKIFQITYALGPMDPSRFGDYVRFLAANDGGIGKKDAEPKGVTGSTMRSKEATGVHAGTNGSLAATGVSEGKSQAGANADLGTTSDASRGESAATAVNASEKKVIRERSSVVNITKGEQELIVGLVPLLPTPRIAKRLVNVYRLLKSSMSLEVLAKFQNERRERSCLLMLAVLFGRPAVAEVLLRALHEQTLPFDKPERSLVEAVRLYSGRNDPEFADERADWQELHRTLSSMKLDQTVGECAREPLAIARYSLAAGRDWHTWRRP